MQKCLNICYLILASMSQRYILGNKQFTRAGILPFMPATEASKIAKELDNLIKTSSSDAAFNEFNVIFSQDIRKNYNGWGDSISDEHKNRLKKCNLDNLKEEHKNLANNKTVPTKMIPEIIKSIWNYVKPSYFCKKVSWETIIGIEPITSKTFEESKGFYKSNTVNYFGGKYDPKDLTITRTAIRETREEARLVFSPNILSDAYQSEMRQKYDFNIPQSIDILVNPRNNTYNRVEVLFMEDVSFEVRSDEVGDFLFVNIE